MKRSFDILASLFLLVLFLPLILLICLLVQMTSVGPIFYISDRIGRSNLKFKMLKFRTMTIDSPVVATHLLMDPERFITRMGGFLRKSSLDELPQLWNILLGDMSLVGPRPALFNQDDLIALRANYGIDELRPGLTGWAQVNGRDELSIQVKVAYELEYLIRKSFWFDVKILFLTLSKVIKRSGISY